MTKSKFQRICDEYVNESLRLDPVMATVLGVHRYDDELGDPSLGAVRRRIEWLKEQKRRLETEIKESLLGPQARIDYLFLQSLIRSGLLILEEQREPERNPILYPDNCMFGIYLLFSRETAPMSKRIEPLLKRMERSPAYLERAQETVHTCPRIFAETALEVTREAPDFFGEIETKLLELFPRRKKRITEATERATAGFAAYAQWIEEKLLPGCTEEFAIGKEIFDARLRDEHLLPYDSESLEKLGWELLRATQNEMNRLAEAIDPGRDWKSVVERAKNDYPPADGILDAYREQVEKGRRFIVERRLAPIPEGEELEVVETPSFERSRTPYAAYLMPGPFEDVQKGSFYVTAVDPTAPQEEQEATLLGHNIHTIPVVTLHEAYPGHHLQLCWANQTKTRLRKIADSSVLAEGWALYCEEMMYEQGYYETEMIRLFQLKDTCLRAARVVVDCRLQTGQMSYQEAIDFMVTEAMLERPNAEAEVKRYVTSPTQPMSYSVGKKVILDLRDEVSSKLGSDFDLHSFHAAVLQAGTLPVGLVREEALQRLELGVA